MKPKPEPIVVVIELLAGFLARFGNVPAEQNAPVFAVHSLAVLLGGRFGKAPLGRKRLQPLAGHRADGDDADAVLAGQRHAGGADLGGHRERHFLL